jgi:putative glutamine amidotransferase
MTRVARIGITANFFHADAERPVFRHKTLQYLEERLALAVFRAGAVPVMLPDLKTEPGLARVVDLVDGVVLAGGADVSPTSYGQTPIDAVRDTYECSLVSLGRARGLPILGVCRGLQLLNVALGGTLWQDITLQVDGALVHRDWHRYDDNGHALRVDASSWVGQVYGGVSTLAVNSVHHQGVAELAPVLRATAWAPDGIIEAVETTDGGSFVAAVQWHPEWLEADRVAEGGPDAGRADGSAIFSAFARLCGTGP